MKSLLCLLLLPACALATESPAPKRDVMVTVVRHEVPALSAPDAIKVSGCVNRPATVSNGEPITVFDALARAGGVSRIGARSRFTISSPRESVSYHYSFAGVPPAEVESFLQRTFLLTGDILYVPELCVL